MISHNVLPIGDRSPRQRSIADQLRHAKLRPTAMRISILGTVGRMRGRFSVEDVYKQLIGADIKTSVASVYRILADLEAAGVVKRDWIPSLGGAKAVFTVLPGNPSNADPNGHRLVCQSCGRSSAILTPAMLELLRQFYSWSSLDPSGGYMAIQADECGACKTPGLNGTPGVRLVASMGSPKPKGQ